MPVREASTTPSAGTSSSAPTPSSETKLAGGGRGPPPRAHPLLPNLIDLPVSGAPSHEPSRTDPQCGGVGHLHRSQPPARVGTTSSQRVVQAGDRVRRSEFRWD